MIFPSTTAVLLKSEDKAVRDKERRYAAALLLRMTNECPVQNDQGMWPYEATRRFRDVYYMSPKEFHAQLPEALELLRRHPPEEQPEKRIKLIHETALLCNRMIHLTEKKLSTLKELKESLRHEALLYGYDPRETSDDTAGTDDLSERVLREAERRLVDAVDVIQPEDGPTDTEKGIW